MLIISKYIITIFKAMFTFILQIRELLLLQMNMNLDILNYNPNTFQVYAKYKMILHCAKTIHSFSSFHFKIILPMLMDLILFSFQMYI